ncbi:hypothetical protein DFP72DRAFT_256149 [Ephemerocybe angulata]|uniref:Uncharacterized protein n=1 Tax=Ephemerocybe angulata TaxID=980116 RepID=A0A8H6LUT1_9AGAR|nr:hypothetical protein DFP72DRAFT_256149 [Tulosesus angulatus]
MSPATSSLAGRNSVASLPSRRAFQQLLGLRNVEHSPWNCNPPSLSSPLAHRKSFYCIFGILGPGCFDSMAPSLKASPRIRLHRILKPPAHPAPRKNFCCYFVMLGLPTARHNLSPQRFKQVMTFLPRSAAQPEYCLPAFATPLAGSISVAISRFHMAWKI